MPGCHGEWLGGLSVGRGPSPPNPGLSLRIRHSSSHQETAAQQGQGLTAPPLQEGKVANNKREDAIVTLVFLSEVEELYLVTSFSQIPTFILAMAPGPFLSTVGNPTALKSYHSSRRHLALKTCPVLSLRSYGPGDEFSPSSLLVTCSQEARHP